MWGISGPSDELLPSHGLCSMQSVSQPVSHTCTSNATTSTRCGATFSRHPACSFSESVARLYFDVTCTQTVSYTGVYTQTVSYTVVYTQTVSYTGVYTQTVSYTVVYTQTISYTVVYTQFPTLVSTLKQFPTLVSTLKQFPTLLSTLTQFPTLVSTLKQFPTLVSITEPQTVRNTAFLHRQSAILRNGLLPGA